jgi:hypothetical protein
MDMTDKPKLEIINGGRANLERRILTLLLQSFGSAGKDRSELDRLIAILDRHANLSVVGDEQVKASGKNDKEQGDTI